MFQVIVLTLIIAVCCISLAQLTNASVMLSIHDKLSSHLLAVRESGSKHARNCVYFQELVSHPMSEHVDELNSLVPITIS